MDALYSLFRYYLYFSYEITVLYLIILIYKALFQFKMDPVGKHLAWLLGFVIALFSIPSSNYLSTYAIRFGNWRLALPPIQLIINGNAAELKINGTANALFSFPMTIFLAAFGFMITVIALFGILHFMIIQKDKRASTSIRVDQTLYRELQLQYGIKKEVTVIITERDRFSYKNQPALVGVSKITIIFPCGQWALLDAPRQKLILAHLLLHVQYRDAVWWKLLRLAKALFFWNPVLRIAIRSILCDLEELGDLRFKAWKGTDAVLDYLEQVPPSKLLCARKIPNRKKQFLLAQKAIPDTVVISILLLAAGLFLNTHMLSWVTIH